MSIRSLFTTVTGFIFLSSPVIGEIEPGASIQINILGDVAQEKGKIDSIYPVSEDETVNMPFTGELRIRGLKAEVFTTTVENAHVAAEIYQNLTIQVMDTAGDQDTIEGPFGG